MNPIKLFKDSLPALTETLESIHAHLERQLETQEKILELLQKMYQQNENKIKDIENIKLEIQKEVLKFFKNDKREDSEHRETNA